MSVARNLKKLYIGNLPWTINSKELMQYFSEYGRVSFARVIFDKDTGLSKGFGYISFSDPTAMEAVFRHEHHVIEGNRVIIQPVTSSRVD